MRSTGEIEVENGPARFVWAAGKAITIQVTLLVRGNGTYTVILQLVHGGNDIWFGFSERGVVPKLTVTAEDPEAS